MELENLIVDNTKLIYSIMKYFKNYSSKEDLFQAGCLGLIDAYKKFDPNMRCKFTTYAYPYIYGAMYSLASNNNKIKINLKTWVKVRKDWQDEDSFVKKFKFN